MPTTSQPPWRRRARIAAIALAAATVLSILVAGPPSGAAPARQAVRISQGTQGNVVQAGQAPDITVRTDAERVGWCVYDYWGNEAAGDAVVRGGSARLDLPATGSGYYRLHVTTTGDCARPSAWTTYAVLPRADRSAAEPFTFGMQAHFAQGWDIGLVRMIDEIGVQSVRDAQPWDQVEDPAGEYHFSAQLEGYLRALRDRQIEPLINFGLTNPHHDPASGGHPGGCTPYSQQGREAFAAYASEVLRHYAALGIEIRRVGVYNEPNLRNFGDAGPGDDGDGGSPYCPANARPTPHRDIAREVYSTLAREHPGVTVSAPELSAGAKEFTDKALPWLRAYLRGPDGTFGGLRNLDVLSLHPYRPGGRTPEGLVTEQLRPVRSYLDAHGGAGTPIWITELGWRTDQVTPRQQASYVPRAYVLAMSAGVRRMHWYNFMDHNRKEFGLIHGPGHPAGDYSPKPSYVAYGVMTAELSGLSYAGRDEPGGALHSHRFTGGDQPVRVMWTTGGGEAVRLAADGPVRVTDLMGGTRTLEPDEQGQIRLTLDGNPKYVRGEVQPSRG